MVVHRLSQITPSFDGIESYSRYIQSNLDYADSLGLNEIVRIIENMNINEEQNWLNWESDILSWNKIFTNRFEKIWSTSSLSAVRHVQLAAIYAPVLCWSLSLSANFLFLDIRYLLRTDAASWQIGSLLSFLWSQNRLFIFYWKNGSLTLQGHDDRK